MLILKLEGRHAFKISAADSKTVIEKTKNLSPDRGIGNLLYDKKVWEGKTLVLHLENRGAPTRMRTLFRFVYSPDETEIQAIEICCDEEHMDEEIRLINAMFEIDLEADI
jgi:hypothetical protein